MQFIRMRGAFTPRVLVFGIASATLSDSRACSDLQLTRGPYLQSGTPAQIALRWRTDVDSDSVVRFGSDPGNLDRSAEDPQTVREHVVTVAGLAPGTRYYYSVGSSSKVLAGGDADHFFMTAPHPGSVRPVRIWAIGDSGSANDRARDVRDGYLDYTGLRTTDVFLMLGDNAYSDGTDSEYQKAVFEMYPMLLRQVPLWPAFGNHDAGSADSDTQSGVYYDIFTLPKNGEAGGLASGTEAYYSFDHANIHFVCLDSSDTDTQVDAAMMTWLDQDLAASSMDWIIAYWHHPPYTKGGHDSDTDTRLINMRERALPLLEAHGVDLVLCGHSHSYERSFLLHGHYDTSDTLEDSMILDDGDGREDGNGSYRKPGGLTQGAVYVVAGCAGKTSDGDFDHPAMFYGISELGSVVLDVDGPILEMKFLRETGAIEDHFTLNKALLPFNAEPELVSSGDTLTVSVEDAQPSSPVLLMLVSIDGKPLPLTVALGFCDSNGRWTLSGQVPGGVVGVIAFQAIGFTGARKIDLSNHDAVEFR